MDTQTGFIRDDLATIIARIEASLAAGFGNVPGDEQRSLGMALSRADGEVANLLYAFIDSVATEALPETAVNWLVRHAEWRGVIRVPAAIASGPVIFTGNAGAPIPLDQRLVLAGQEYAVDADAVIGEAGSVSVAVSALVAGRAGNQPEGAALALLTPLAGVNAAAAVGAGGLSGGADIEGIEALRQRLREHVRMPPHGGNPDDYVKWAKAHSAAITRVWPFKNGMGRGSVVVFFMMDGSYDDGIPEAGDVAALLAYYNQPGIAPVQANVYVVAPVAQPITFQISGLVPATLAVKAAVEAGLRDLVRSEAKPYGDLLLTHVQQAVSLAAGEHDHVLVYPAANLTPDDGKVFTFGGIDWL